MSGLDVSIVIPAYNSRGFIRRSISSALAQQGVSFEIIVVDDGSTDQTDELIRLEFPSVQLISQSNAGQANARNRGVSAASGEFIAFLDADDWWDATKLRKQVDFLRSNSTYSFCFTDFRGVDQTGLPHGWQGGLKSQLEERGLLLIPSGEKSFQVAGSVLNTLIRHTSFIHPSTILIERDFFGSVGGFDESRSPAEDLELWIRMASRGSCGFIDELLVTTEARPGSQGRQFERMTRQLIRIYSEIPKNHPEIPHELKTLTQRCVMEKSLTLSWYLRQSGDYQLARNLLLQAIFERFSTRLLLEYFKCLCLQAARTHVGRYLYRANAS